MVRVNLISPSLLLDQHLNAENVEILMLKGTNLKGDIPKSYRLGKGHILFFKDKPNYLTIRQYAIKWEMIQRGFKNSVDLPLIIGESEFKPSQEDYKIIISRLKEKVLKKPNYYNYKSNKVDVESYLNVLEAVSINTENTDGETLNQNIQSIVTKKGEHLN